MQLFALKIHVTKPNFMENSGILQRVLHLSHVRKGPQVLDQQDPWCAHHVPPPTQILHREDAGRVRGAQNVKVSEKQG